MLLGASLENTQVFSPNSISLRDLQKERRHFLLQRLQQEVSSDPSWQQKLRWLQEGGSGNAVLPFQGTAVIFGTGGKLVPFPYLGAEECARSTHIP